MNGIENRNDWLNELATDTKLKIAKWARNTLKLYRECGQGILKSGYKKGKWNSRIREQFLKLTGISLRAFYYMIELGSMTDEEFCSALQTFPSLNAWINGKSVIRALPLIPSSESKSKATMEHLEIPSKEFPNEQEAKNFFRALGGEYKGLFYHGSINKKLAARKDEILGLDDERQLIKCPHCRSTIRVEVPENGKLLCNNCHRGIIVSGNGEVLKMNWYDEKRMRETRHQQQEEEVRVDA